LQLGDIQQVEETGIVAAMTGNAHYATPAPALADITTAVGAFTAAVADAVDGGKTLTAIKNERRAALVALMRQLASYVQATCNEDMAVLLSSGFPNQKPQREPFGVRAAPSNLRGLSRQRAHLDTAPD
jgi:hypothetical protein